MVKPDMPGAGADREPGFAFGSVRNPSSRHFIVPTPPFRRRLERGLIWSEASCRHIRKRRLDLSWRRVLSRILKIGLFSQILESGGTNERRIAIRYSCPGFVSDC
jgi:hypothetical protein